MDRFEVHSATVCQRPFVQGFGVTSRSTVDTRKLDPTAIIVFHQAYVSCRLLLVPLLRTFAYFRDVGEYLRDEVTLTLPLSAILEINSLAGHVILIVTGRSSEPDVRVT
jgi:hypothetical protein